LRVGFPRGHRVDGTWRLEDPRSVRAGTDQVEEVPDPLPGLDRTGSLPVDPGRAGTLVAPHPIPRNQKERGIGDEVEQVVEPAMRIITSPTVQLGLDLQYPVLGHDRGVLQFVGIHRR